MLHTRASTPGIGSEMVILVLDVLTDELVLLILFQRLWVLLCKEVHTL